MASYDYRDGGAYGYEQPQVHHAQHPAQGAPEPSGRAASRWVNLAGALTSVAMIGGLVVWGYKLAMRDLNGVPVIRALDGPARIAPADPGGELARHTGLSVNDVAGTGQVAPPPEAVTLAPPPEGFAPEDIPMGELKPTEEAVAQGPEAEAPQPAASDASAPADPDAVAKAVAALAPAALEANPDQLDAAPAPVVEPGALSPAEPELRPDAIAGEATDPGAQSPDVIPASVPGVSHSPRPQAKPMHDDQLLAAALEQAVTKQMSGASLAAKTVDIDPASLSAGTRLAQLGAFDTAETAKAEWDRIAQRFDALMAGKKRVIQKASSGGRDFYRLRVAGFSDVAEARQFCAALQAERQNCIPTQAR
ncbi:SPOR domain-containing protein [Thioclava atlantica]|uniref:Sporulation domain-containing protein n=1 Tax=Thioclava atlantica TaxID=1317124 RepID=A0A085TSR1_9RHOB|nr:SPOR domain-containing protein [Thioclava atlantica]KFE33758.1 sporulation domain-containing protein [Thioclava atlantica]